MAGADLVVKEGGMIEELKAWAPFVGAVVAMIAGWWAWRTSYLKALADRVTHLEGKLDVMATSHAAERMRVAELTSENITLRAAVAERDRTIAAKDEEIAKWRTRWEARRERQITNPGEEDSEADALDDLAADRSDASGVRVRPAPPAPSAEGKP